MKQPTHNQEMLKQVQHDTREGLAKSKIDMTREKDLLNRRSAGHVKGRG